MVDGEERVSLAWIFGGCVKREKKLGDYSWSKVLKVEYGKNGSWSSARCSGDQEICSASLYLDSYSKVFVCLMHLSFASFVLIPSTFPLSID